MLAPKNGRTAVVARAIDTNDDAEDELDQTWEGPLTELDGMLASAFFTIERWKSRERKGPIQPPLGKVCKRRVSDPARGYPGAA